MFVQRLWLLLLLPCSALLSGSAAYEFTAFRMQQFNLGQHQHGCRGAMVVAEARSADDSALFRRCVVMRVGDFTERKVLEAQRQKAAAILVLLPQNMTDISQEDIQTFSQTEHLLLSSSSSLTPVYVAVEDDQLMFMYQELQATVASRASSVFIRVFRSFVTSTAFQVLVSNSAPIRGITDTTVVAIEGVLRGSGEDPPTIVITAHYDSYGLAPWRAFGADSNGSGVALILELIRVFHQLYRTERTRPQMNLMFALTGGGKFNFIGTKRWIEENLDHTEWSLLHDTTLFVLCLDTLGSGDRLFAHVSKPPRPDSAMGQFISVLQEIISSRFPSLQLSLVHKKINLVESSVLWEHERFSLRRVPAFTLSRLQDPKAASRGSVTDTLSQVDVRRLKRNGLIIAEALGRFIFNLTHVGSPKEIQLFTGHMDLLDSRLSSLLSALVLVPRAAQLLDQDPNQALLLDSVEQDFRRFLDQVQRFNFRTDKRDPEVTFFDQMKQPLVMYRVKPAAFDLFLGGCIAVYLGLVYSAVQNMSWVYSRLKTAVKTKSQ